MSLWMIVGPIVSTTSSRLCIIERLHECFVSNDETQVLNDRLGLLYMSTDTFVYHFCNQVYKIIQPIGGRFEGIWTPQRTYSHISLHMDGDFGFGTVDGHYATCILFGFPMTEDVHVPDVAIKSS